MQHPLITEVSKQLEPYFAINDILMFESTLAAALEQYDVRPKQQLPVAPMSNTPELISKYLISMKLRRLSDRSIHQYKYILTKFFEYLLKPVQDTTADDINTYLYSKMMAGAKDSYVDNIQSALSAFFEWCAISDYILISPCTKVKRKRGIHQTINPLTERQIEEIRLKYLNRPLRERALFEFLLSTGCRCAEAASVKLQDINWQNNSIEIVGKGSKPRTVFMSERAHLMLLEYLNQDKSCSEYLFKGKDKRHDVHKELSCDTIQHDVESLGNLISIHLHPHMLRHTFATIAVDRGMPIEELQVLMGHSHLDTTMIYVKINKNNIKYHYSKCRF